MQDHLIVATQEVQKQQLNRHPGKPVGQHQFPEYPNHQEFGCRILKDSRGNPIVCKTIFIQKARFQLGINTFAGEKLADILVRFPGRIKQDIPCQAFRLLTLVFLHAPALQDEINIGQFMIMQAVGDNIPFNIFSDAQGQPIVIAIMRDLTQKVSLLQGMHAEFVLLPDRKYNPSTKMLLPARATHQTNFLNPFAFQWIIRKLKKETGDGSLSKNQISLKPKKYSDEDIIRDLVCRWLY
jgi:hypothetical protein